MEACSPKKFPKLSCSDWQKMNFTQQECLNFLVCVFLITLLVPLHQNSLTFPGFPSCWTPCTNSPRFVIQEKSKETFKISDAYFSSEGCNIYEGAILADQDCPPNQEYRRVLPLINSEHQLNKLSSSQQ